MKIRAGFVSNSSTSSFTCDLCGFTAVAGMGVGIHEYNDVATCENRHNICSCHALDDLSERQAELLEAYDNLQDDGYEGDELYGKLESDYGHSCPEDFMYSFPECYCPICQMEGLNTEDAFKVIVDHIGSERVKNMIREAINRFDSREDFDEYHKGITDSLSDIEELVI